MTAGEIMTLLKVRGYLFNRALGQHFLCEDETVQAIVRAAEPEGRNVLEIGPGAGVMTGELSKLAKQVLAIELDRALIPILNTVLTGFGNIEIVREDVMRVDLAKLVQERFDGEEFDVVSNLPYSITTPVLTLLLKGDLPIRRMTVMVQSEASERILAKEGRAYGPLAILAQYRTRVERLFDVSRKQFMPPPNVDSTILRMDFRGYETSAQDEQHFFRIVRIAFSMRRKTLVNNLKSLRIPQDSLLEILDACGIDPRARAEQIPLTQFIELSNRLLCGGYVIF